MAKDPRYSVESINAKADAVCALLSNGFLRLYDGVRPLTADDPITTQVLLAELRFGTPAFGAAVAGVAAATAITPDSAANATGIATWFRALKANGTSPVYDGTIGAGDIFDFVMNSVNIQVLAVVAASAFIYTEPGQN